MLCSGRRLLAALPCQCSNTPSPALTTRLRSKPQSATAPTETTEARSITIELVKRRRETTMSDALRISKMHAADPYSRSKGAWTAAVLVAPN